MNRKFFAFNPYSIHTLYTSVTKSWRSHVPYKSVDCQKDSGIHECFLLSRVWVVRVSGAIGRCTTCTLIYYTIHYTHWIWAMAFNNLDVFDDTTIEMGKRRTLSSNTHTRIKSKNIASRFIYRFPVRVLLLFDLHSAQSKDEATRTSMLYFGHKSWSLNVREHSEREAQRICKWFAIDTSPERRR